MLNIPSQHKILLKNRRQKVTHLAEDLLIRETEMSYLPPDWTDTDKCQSADRKFGNSSNGISHDKINSPHILFAGRCLRRCCTAEILHGRPADHEEGQD